MYHASSVTSSQGCFLLKQRRHPQRTPRLKRLGHLIGRQRGNCVFTRSVPPFICLQTDSAETVNSGHMPSVFAKRDSISDRQLLARQGHLAPDRHGKCCFFTVRPLISKTLTSRLLGKQSNYILFSQGGLTNNVESDN